ncbi:MAG: enoyl-CoA hydratase/isomerase family protein, partial [Pseudomonadota bacterium]
MDFKNILFEIKDEVGIITINIPERLNPINLDVELEILKAFQEVDEREEVKAAIITGAGEKAFSAGADIKPYLEMELVKSFSYLKKLHDAEWAIENLRKPTLAAINGLCLGGGFELALACTLRFASENAKMGLPEINVGCIPGNGGIQRLGRLIGKSRAMWYLLTGEFFTAQEALQMGVVNKVVPQSELMDTCMNFLQNNLLKKSPTAVWAIRKSLNLGM